MISSLMVPGNGARGEQKMLRSIMGVAQISQCSERGGDAIGG